MQLIVVNDTRTGGGCARVRLHEASDLRRLASCSHAVGACAPRAATIVAFAAECRA
ncbi:hypothetical protein BDSB_17650 [Burkholderia dolosa PC543]|nr:hypothetical protein BDSB_17650 [Burkholderia dolosa PC543]